MNKIIIHYTLISLFYASIWHTPLSHGAAAVESTLHRRTTRRRADINMHTQELNPTADHLALIHQLINNPELQCLGITEDDITSYTQVLSLTPNKREPLIKAITELIANRKLLEHKTELLTNT